MPIHLQKHKLTYVSVPKCACSSLKQYFFAIEHGRPFHAEMTLANRRRLHGLYPSVPFDEIDQTLTRGHQKIAVVRGPVSRLVSCFEDKLLGGKFLEQGGVQERCEKRGLPLKPDLATFVERLEAYRECSKVIRRHSCPIAEYLGPDPNWYDAIFDMSEIELLRRYVAQITGSKIAIPHANRSTKKAAADAVTDEIRAAILRKFASDVDLYGRWMK